MLTENVKAPKFRLQDKDGKEYTLESFKGKKLVLYFYPKDNTPGCSRQAAAFAAAYEEIKSLGAEVVGVSKDKEALQKKFADAHGLEFPLIADVDTTLLQTLGCWGEKVACGRRTIGTLRTTYLVNEEGIIEKIFTPKEIKTKIHAEQILAYLNNQA